MSNSTIAARRKLLKLVGRELMESLIDHADRPWAKSSSEIVDHLVANWSEDVEQAIRVSFGRLMVKAGKTV